METIGKTLKDARNKMNKSLEDIHEQTRIAREHLQLIESDDFSFLPQTYVKSFLKSYADAVNLDGNALVERLEQLQKAQEEQRQARDEEHSEQPTDVGLKSRYLEWALGFASFALLVCLILVYVEYRSQIHAEPTNTLTEQRSETHSELAEIAVERSDSAKTTDIFPLELAVTARKHLWLKLTIDEKDPLEYNLVPDQNLTWNAENRVEIVIGELKKNEPSNRPAAIIEPHENEALQLTFVKDRNARNDD